jgi:hypothetical protein
MNADYVRVIAASDEDRRALFAATARRVGTTEQDVEKDFWVCWTLDALFRQLPAEGPRLLCKGGTVALQGVRPDWRWNAAGTPGCSSTVRTSTSRTLHQGRSPSRRRRRCSIELERRLNEPSSQPVVPTRNAIGMGRTSQWRDQSRQHAAPRASVARCCRSLGRLRSDVETPGPDDGDDHEWRQAVGGQGQAARRT